MKDVQERYSDRIKNIIEKDGIKEDNSVVTKMYVKGKIADWLIVDRAWKSNVQKVKTFVYRNNETISSTGRRRYRKPKYEEYQQGWWSGPICIDNIHNNSSVGDQFVARAMALLNDSNTVKLVNTISQYLTAGMMDGTQMQRLSWDAIGKEDENWSELDYMKLLGVI